RPLESALNIRNRRAAYLRILPILFSDFCQQPTRMTTLYQRLTELRIVIHAILVCPQWRSAHTGTACNPSRSGYLVPRSSPRTAAAKHTRSGTTLPPSCQHRQCCIPAIGERSLGRVSTWKRCVHSKEQTGDSASPNARSRSSYCEPFPFG